MIIPRGYGHMGLNLTGNRTSSGDGTPGLMLLISSDCLDDSLQLPSIPDRVLNDLSARHQDLLLTPHTLPLLQREVYPPILHHPVPAPGKLHHAAFALQKKQILRVGDGQRRVSFFRARCDLRADRTDEYLTDDQPSATASDQAKQRGPPTSLNTPNSSPGTPSRFVAPHTRS